MPTTDASTGTGATQPPPDYAVVGVYPTVAAGFDHGLVVLAMRLPYWLEPQDAGYHLLVEEQHLARVHTELAAFERECATPPARNPDDETAARRPAWGGPLLWALMIQGLFWLQTAHPGKFETAGALDAEALFERGEWWRPITALWLHADLAHATANALSGCLVFTAVLTTFGRLRGAALLGVAAIAGNLAAVGLQSAGPYRSLGASTAVFAGLGLLTGRAVRRTPLAIGLVRAKAVAVPLGAGLALLGLLGAGGFRTDVIAHATGFACGLLAGLAAAFRQGEKRS